MTNKFRKAVSGMVAVACAALGSVSCVYIDGSLGSGFIPNNQLYDTYITTFPLKEITMKSVDSLSGYSADRIVIGSLRGEDGVLETRKSAFTLIPIYKDFDFGENAKVRQFHVSVPKDTLSYEDESQMRIIQNLYVYELDSKLSKGDTYIGASDLEKYEAGLTEADIITEGIPVYAGGDSLSFDFSLKWAQEYVDKYSKLRKEGVNLYDSIGAYTAHFPGIFVKMGEPAGSGGRINLFRMPLDCDVQSMLLKGSYAELKITADYGERKDVDTTFFFFYGAQDFSIRQNADIYNTGTATPQYALNLASVDGKDSRETEVPAGDFIYVESGSGLKPVVSAREIYDILHKTFADSSFESNRVVINKATVMFHFDFPGTEKIKHYPEMLSPTCKINPADSVVTYGGITDASVASENPGKINKSTYVYAPDISHHVQQIISLKDDDDFSERDVWFLIMKEEQIVDSGQDNAATDYMNNLMYNGYYGGMYDPYGYGGYGYGYGYGGYGYGYGSYGYNNYYNYQMAAMYMSGYGQDEAKVEVMLDRDRYYRATLKGPSSETGYPEMRVVYSVRRK